jgi:hypothetical protein
MKAIKILFLETFILIISISVSGPWLSNKIKRQLSNNNNQNRITNPIDKKSPVGNEISFKEKFL